MSVLCSCRLFDFLDGDRSCGVDWHEIESREAWVLFAEGCGDFLKLLVPIFFEDVNKKGAKGVSFFAVINYVSLGV